MSATPLPIVTHPAGVVVVDGAAASYDLREFRRTVFAVLGNNGGAHEPEPVLSLWTEREAAEREVERWVEAYKAKFPGVRVRQPRIAEWPVDSSKGVDH
jgi:hypothetical protein